MTTTADDRAARFALVTAGHHFLLNVLPFRQPDSRAALARFAATVERTAVPSAVLDAVLLRCVVILDERTERRIPSLTERYLAKASGPARPLARFIECVDDVLRYHGITDGSVQEAVEYIRGHYADSNLDPHMVARHVSVRLATLDAAFNRQMNCTVTKHLRTVRLDRAAVLLASTGRSIKEVWASVGYNHHSNFDHDFKRHFGLNPRAFRERSIRPLAERHYGSAHGPSAADHAAPARTHTSVLIVDDDEGTRSTVGLFLRHEGLRVHATPTGTEGLLLAREHRPDAILLDYHLDDMNGLDFLRTLRGGGAADTPAVALFSADWNLEDRAHEAHALGAVIASKLCDLDNIKQLVTYISRSTADPRQLAGA